MENSGGNNERQEPQIKPPDKAPQRQYTGLINRIFAGDLNKAITRFTERLSNRYEFFPSLALRKEIVEISSNVTDYLHDNNITNLMLVDRSARPAYLGIREAFKRKYPDSPIPNIYFVNPTGFLNFYELQEEGEYGMRKGDELMYEGLLKGNESGSLTSARLQGEIEQDLAQTYKRLSNQKSNPLLLFDMCIHSGESIKPVLDTLKKVGFDNVKFGIVAEDRNESGIKPDLVALSRPALGSCYPFDQDRMTHRTFDSVTSTPTRDLHARDHSVRLRKEITRIFRQAPSHWFGRQQA